MHYHFDILIIGSGIAGLSAALKANPGLKVALLTKGPKPDGSTNYAQGGIASVSDPNDRFEFHIQDTLEAGDGLCDPKRVEILANEGPATIQQLISWGVQFTRDSKGTPDLALEGGHSHRRILHTDDLTGKEIMRALLFQARTTSNIFFFENRFVVDLLVSQEATGKKSCVGAEVLNRNTGEFEHFYGKSVIICTGGSGEVFLYSTNPPVSGGDGVAIAYRAGAIVQDLEFMQFHPTSLYEQKSGKAFLISEAVRGFGGVLRSWNGEEFMDGIHPLKSLAPRDIVARAIDAQMKKSGAPHVWLDITARERKELKAKFPNIFEKCYSIGIDISKNPIPVVPAAHYQCGGVQVDSKSRTSIRGLYCCGEAASTGVHGANRLASNSLLESVVFAIRAMHDINNNIAKISPPRKKQIHQPKIKKSGTAYRNIKTNLQTLMWRHVGIVRSDANLKIALSEIINIRHQIKDALNRKGRHPQILFELKNMALFAELMVRSALLRKESRGLHYSIDYPNKKLKATHTRINPGIVES
jgi:L-aspartate oxidase